MRVLPASLRWVLCTAVAAVLAGPWAPPARADDAACLPLLEQAQGLLAEAEQASRFGQDAKAQGIAVRGLALLDRAGDLCPDNLDVAGRGVLLAAFAGNVDRGLHWLERYAALTRLGERDPRLHYLRAVLEVRLIGRPDQAVRSLERMQALEPGLHVEQRDLLYYEALLGHAAMLVVEDRHAEALRLQQAAEALARRAGKLARARRARALAGMTLAGDERFQEAADLFRALCAEDPQHPAWPYHLGLMLAQLFNYDEAIVLYRQSLRLQEGWNDRPEMLADLGRARLRLGNCLRLKAGRMAPGPEREALVREAQAELERFCTLWPRDALGPFWLGVLAYEEKDRPLEALAAFERAFALDPDCPTTLDYMLNAHARAGGPVPPDQPPASEAEMAAWQAKGEAWRTEQREGAKRRKAVIAERARKTGDPQGGCL